MVETNEQLFDVLYSATTFQVKHEKILLVWW
jgi:hypothetical protein